MTVEILLATPCYGNQMLRGYFHSVLKLHELCRSLGYGLDISTIGNESLITRGRNYFVSLMLSNKKYTHILYVDADITFDPQSVIRMVQSEKDVVAGAYAKKSINWGKVHELITKNPSLPIDVLEPLSHDYAINILHQKNPSEINIPIVNGFMKVSYVATGFLLIKRQVLEKLVQVHPEWKYNNDVGGYDNGSNTDYFYSVFDCIIDPHTKRYLSEDYAFCCRWLELGGDIWLDLLCNLNHTGSYEFKGAYVKVIEQLLNEQNQSKQQVQPDNPEIENIKNILKSKIAEKKKTKFASEKDF